MLNRRFFVKAGTASALLGGFGVGKIKADVPDHLWTGYDFGPGPRVKDRLNQGPFGIDQTDAWATIGSTSPSEKHIKNLT